MWAHPALFGLSLSKPSLTPALKFTSKPGLAPAGEALFFASPKKSTQKKGDPMVWDPYAALRATCGAR
jgi:hypothetical protein